MYVFLAPWNFFSGKNTWIVIAFCCSVLQQNPKLHWKPILSVCSTEMIFLELNPKQHYIISRKQDREIKISYSKRKSTTSKKSIVLASWVLITQAEHHYSFWNASKEFPKYLYFKFTWSTNIFYRKGGWFVFLFLTKSQQNFE